MDRLYSILLKTTAKYLLCSCARLYACWMLCNLLRPNTITLIITAITITTKIKSNSNRNNNVIANAIARRWRFLHVLKFAKKNMDYFKVNNPAMLNYNLQINVLIQWIFAENASAFNRRTKMVIDANKTNIKQCQHHIEKLNKWHQRNMLRACYGNFVNIECCHSLYFWIVNRQTVSFRTIPWGQTKSFQFYSQNLILHFYYFYYVHSRSFIAATKIQLKKLVQWLRSLECKRYYFQIAFNTLNIILSGILCVISFKCCSIQRNRQNISKLIQSIMFHFSVRFTCSPSQTKYY